MLTLLRNCALAGFAVLALPLHAAEPAAGAASEGSPAIWLLSDHDTRIWMFGTVHVIPPHLDWRSTALNRIIEDVDELVLETDNGYGVMDKPELMQSLMLRDAPAPILQRIGPEYRNRMRLIAKSMGMSAEDFDPLETWAVSLLLMTMGDDDLGGRLDPGDEPSGVEIELSELFDEADKPITGVETELVQLGVFRNLSEAGQRALLESMLEEPDEGDVENDETLDTWLAGNTDKMAAECNEFEEMPPEAFRRLIVDRNTAWTGWLIDRLDRPGDILFAVGACHLAGRSSLQHMLAARGFTVERVR